MGAFCVVGNERVAVEGDEYAGTTVAAADAIYIAIDRKVTMLAGRYGMLGRLLERAAWTSCCPSRRFRRWICRGCPARCFRTPSGR